MGASNTQVNPGPKMPLASCPVRCSLSFVIPVKNDPRVYGCIDSLLQYIAQEKITAEVVVCSIPQQNGFSEIVRYVEANPDFKGECVRTGVLTSKGDVIIICDADFPVTFGDLNALRSALDNADVALGNRYLQSSRILHTLPNTRRVASIAFRTLVRLVFNLPGFDTQCGIKAFKHAAGHKIFRRQIIKGLAFDVEVVVRARALGLRMKQVPVHWKSSEVSTIHPWRVAPAMVKDVLRLWIRRRIDRWR